MMKYYYIDDVSKLQCGPFKPHELLHKNIRPETVVWRSGMQDWVEAGTLQELAFLFDSKIPAPQELKEDKELAKPIPSIDSHQRASGQGERKQFEEQHKWDGIIPIPKNWLVESILFTIFCCSPISLAGIFYAVKVESLYYAKEYDAAQEASRKAKLWTLSGIFFLPACYMLLFLLGLGLSLFSYL